MADTCYLCEMGGAAYLVSGLGPGEGFGTCESCSVHACPRHGERGGQHFRCADCIAASGSKRALRGGPPVGPDAHAHYGDAARLAALSSNLRDSSDPPRMAAGLRWLRGRLRSGEPLFLAADAHDGFGDDRRELLALSTDVEPDAAEEAALIRAEHLEARFREEIGDVAERDEDEALDDDRNDEALLAIGALAIAYFGRGAMDLATSPLEMRGGLTLPAVIAVLGHAYSQANRLFW